MLCTHAPYAHTCFLNSFELFQIFEICWPKPVNFFSTKKVLSLPQHEMPKRKLQETCNIRSWAREASGLLMSLGRRDAWRNSQEVSNRKMWKIQIFGLEQGKPLVCSCHWEEGMRDVIQKKCQNEGCEKVSTFGLQSRKPLFCVSHCEEGMCYVIHKKCRTERCENFPIFGLEQGKPLVCLCHREEGMCYVIHKKCQKERCEKVPIFGLEQGKPLVCSCHHEEGMLDVIHKKCQTEGCDKITSNRKYKGHCLHCFMHLFPQEKISRNYKIDLQRDWSEQPYHWTILFNYCNARQTHSRWLFSKATWHS